MTERKPISERSSVTVGFAALILSGIIWNIVWMVQLERDIREHYVTRDLFEARVQALSDQIADLKQEVRRSAR